MMHVIPSSPSWTRRSVSKWIKRTTAGLLALSFSTLGLAVLPGQLAGADTGKNSSTTRSTARSVKAYFVGDEAIVVRGANWPANAKVALTLDYTTSKAGGTTTVGESKRFAATSLVPAGYKGTVTISAAVGSAAPLNTTVEVASLTSLTSEAEDGDGDAVDEILDNSDTAITTDETDEADEPDDAVEADELDEVQTQPTGTSTAAAEAAAKAKADAEAKSRADAAAAESAVAAAAAAENDDETAEAEDEAASEDDAGESEDDAVAVTTETADKIDTAGETALAETGVTTMGLMSLGLLLIDAGLVIIWYQMGRRERLFYS